MMEIVQPLFDRAYFAAALMVLGLGLWLALSAPAWRGRILGVVLSQAGALVMMLGAGAAPSLIGVLIAIMATSIALASALLMRLQSARAADDATDSAP